MRYTAEYLREQGMLAIKEAKAKGTDAKNLYVAVPVEDLFLLAELLEETESNIETEETHLIEDLDDEDLVH